MKAFLMLIRRELWEHRMLTFVPAFITVLSLLGVLIMFFLPSRLQTGMQMDGRAQIQMDLREGHNYSFKTDDFSVKQLVLLYDRLPEDTRGLLINGALHGLAAGFLPLMLILIVSYLLDCLYKERKDRSVLFWKSLPISDRDTVLSKLITGLIVVPLITLLAIMILQLLVMSLASVVALVCGASIWGSVWGPAEPLRIWLTGIQLWGVLLLYYMPLATWMLLASAWARKSPFLHAVAPVIVLALAEKIILGSDRFIEWIMEWMAGGVAVLANGSVTRYAHTLSFGVSNLGSFMTQPSIYVGLLVSVGFLLATIRVRRWRELG
ncbi:MAG: ABC-2 transporter permease [Candidatus Delongbacteria bacterium]|nr:ABC-2 transporter permease [Candidatus Delongbacteria bacterium]